MIQNNQNDADQLFAYSEATASWTVRYVDPAGFECILTLQAETGAEVLKRANGAIAHLTEKKCLPVQKMTFKSNGRSNEKSSSPTLMVKPNEDEKAVTCPIHNVEMQKWSKDGRSWYAHRWEDGWCHGK